MIAVSKIHSAYPRFGKIFVDVSWRVRCEAFTYREKEGAPLQSLYATDDDIETLVAARENLEAAKNKRLAYIAFNQVLERLYEKREALPAGLQRPARQNPELSRLHTSRKKKAKTGKRKTTGLALAPTGRKKQAS